MNTPRETEYRSTVVSKVEPNTAGPQQDGLPKQFWARVMNYGELDDFGTKFKPGVFKKSLDRRLPRLMYGHQGWENPSALLGRGIDYRDTHDGLEVLFEFDDFDYVPAAKQIAHQMTNHPDNPTLDQFSVGFKRVKDERAAQQDGGGVWITEARLGEVSVVVEGAVPGTKTLQFRGANGTIVEGQTIDAQDAARLLAELSTGKLDLAEALMAVKSLAAETDDEPDDPFADEPDEPDPDDPELDDEQLAELRKWIDAVDAEEEAAAQAKLAADDALLASIDADLSIVSRSLPFEARGEGAGHHFHGNQHSGGGGASSSGGGESGLKGSTRNKALDAAASKSSVAWTADQNNGSLKSHIKDADGNEYTAHVSKNGGRGGGYRTQVVQPGKGGDIDPKNPSRGQYAKEVHGKYNAPTPGAAIKDIENFVKTLSGATSSHSAPPLAHIAPGT